MICGKLRGLFILSFLFSLLAHPEANAEGLKFHEEGPFHEAFITRVSVDLAFEAIPVDPPKPLQEKQPRQLDIQSVWIPGYWSWNKITKDFVWVSGVWRRPPPAHSWVSGFWKESEQGFVWLPGYWSPITEHKVNYISLAPPDALDENPAPPPSENYFWIPGYWGYLFDKHAYFWVKGHWEELDPSWVFIPSHYIWRPGGFVFVPGFWDWALEQRGTVFASATVEAPLRKMTTLDLAQTIKPEALIRNLFPSYPDYLTLFQHHLYFHPEYWKEFCCAPIWWDWMTWWSFSSHDQWSLWWWYTHPGYSEPSWMTKEIRGILPPPLEGAILMVKRVIPPPIVMPERVVTRDELLEAIKKGTGQFSPIIPYEKRQVTRIYQTLRLEGEQHFAERPIGRKLPIDPSTFRPSVRKPVIAELGGWMASKMMPEEILPKLPAKPKIPSSSRGQAMNQQSAAGNVANKAPSVRRPSWSPRHESRSEVGISSQDEQGVLKNWKLKDRSLDPETKWRAMKPRSEEKISRPPLRTPATGRLEQ